MYGKLRLILFVLIVHSVSFTVNAQDETLSNREIIALTKAGFSRVFIIQKIQVSKSAFDITTPKLIELKTAGVDEGVISEMLKANSVGVDPTVTLTPKPDINSTPKQTPTPTPTPKTILTKDSSTATASTASDDPICLKARLDKLNTSNYIRNICDLVDNAIAQDPRELSMDNAATPLLELFVAEVSKRNKLFTNDAEKSEAAKDFFLEADKNRTDKQIGSTSGSAGSTSLAVRGGAPSIIGWAVEQGAATSSISGNTVTVRINPFGLMRAVQGEGFLGREFLNNLTNRTTNNSASNDLAFSNFLRKFSTAFSFDSTRGQATPTFIVSKQQLSAVSVRYEFINQRTPQSKEAQKLFRNFVDDSSLILKEQGDLINSLEKSKNDGTLNNRVLQEWLDITNKEIQAIPNPAEQKLEEIKKLLKPGDKTLEQILNLITPVAQRNYKEAVRVIIEKRIALFPVDELLKDPIVKTAFEKFASLTLSYVEKRKAFSEEVNKGTVATFEYTNNREPIAPDTSNFRFIWENGRFLKNTDFTLNASLTMYNKKPTFAGVKRFRDFQFALQTDTSLGNTFGTGNTILTFAGKYERLNGDTVDALGMVKPNSKGDVAVGQFKFTIPIADWGIKLPISITFANRSDLIKESTIRANFGFTFDLDPIFARFKPF